MKTHIVEENNANLVDAITGLLAEYNHHNPKAWKNGLDPDAFTSTVEVQRFLINRQWRQILGNVTQESTMDARYCLVDEGPIKDWLRLFEDGVMPIVMKYNLPN